MLHLIDISSFRRPDGGGLSGYTEMTATYKLKRAVGCSEPFGQLFPGGLGRIRCWWLRMEYGCSRTKLPQHLILPQ
jgi:hypothetical protein